MDISVEHGKPRELIAEHVGILDHHVESGVDVGLGVAYGHPA